MERYVRILLEDGAASYGLAEGGEVALLKGCNPQEFVRTGRRVPLREDRLLTPCVPGKILCSGLNYKDAILEDGAAFPQKPLLFLKPATAITGNGKPVVKTSMVHNLTIEGELAVVIGKKGKKIPRDQAMDYIWGYMAANDVTAKDLQKEDGQWTRAKSFDTFLPLGSEIVGGLDPLELTVASYINGREVQKGYVRDMLFDIPTMVSFASEIMTLEPGDLILTGTPGGYGKPAGPGDQVTIRIPQVGEITNGICGEQGF